MSPSEKAEVIELLESEARGDAQEVFEVLSNAASLRLGVMYQLRYVNT